MVKKTYVECCFVCCSATDGVVINMGTNGELEFCATCVQIYLNAFTDAHSLIYGNRKES